MANKNLSPGELLGTLLTTIVVLPFALVVAVWLWTRKWADATMDKFKELLEHSTNG